MAPPDYRPRRDGLFWERRTATGVHGNSMTIAVCPECGAAISVDYDNRYIKMHVEWHERLRNSDVLPHFPWED